MTRSILAVLAATVSITVVAGTGCNSTGVGDPCTPEAEYSQYFLGFADSEVNIESKSFQCQTRLCLANHFQGRVTCPYGQDINSSGAVIAPPGATSPCSTPIGEPVTGINPVTGVVDNPMVGATVSPECVDRTAADAVYCSCRCANIDGQTNDGANYCTCPSGFSCTQLVSSIGATDQNLAGAYCIKNGTEYSPGNSCLSFCDADLKNCGTLQL